MANPLQQVSPGAKALPVYAKPNPPMTLTQMQNSGGLMGQELCAKVKKLLHEMGQNENEGGDYKDSPQYIQRQRKLKGELEKIETALDNLASASNPNAATQPFNILNNAAKKFSPYAKLVDANIQKGLDQDLEKGISAGLDESSSHDDPAKSSSHNDPAESSSHDDSRQHSPTPRPGGSSPGSR